MSTFNPTSTVVNADGSVEQHGDFSSVSNDSRLQQINPGVTPVGNFSVGRDAAADLAALEADIAGQIARVNANPRLDADTKAAAVESLNATLAYQKARAGRG